MLYTSIGTVGYREPRGRGMISQKAKYALRALVALCKVSSREPLMISEISRDQGIPKKFLEQILLELKRHGIVMSRRGRLGGYVLLREPENVTFGEVLRLDRRADCATALPQQDRLSPLLGLRRRGHLRDPPRVRPSHSRHPRGAGCNDPRRCSRRRRTGHLVSRQPVDHPRILVHHTHRSPPEARDCNEMAQLNRRKACFFFSRQTAPPGNLVKAD